jgi:hypothetical protein
MIVRPKVKDLKAEQFLPPLKVPQGLYDVEERKDPQTMKPTGAWTAKLMTGRPEMQSQDVQKGDVVVYYDNGTRTAFTPEEFKEKFEEVSEEKGPLPEAPGETEEGNPGDTDAPKEIPADQETTNEA